MENKEERQQVRRYQNFNSLSSFRFSFDKTYIYSVQYSYPFTISTHIAPLYFFIQSKNMNKVFLFALLAIFASSNAFAPSTTRSALARPDSCVFAEVRFHLIYLHN